MALEFAGSRILSLRMKCSCDSGAGLTVDGYPFGIRISAGQLPPAHASVATGRIIHFSHRMIEKFITSIWNGVINSRRKDIVTGPRLYLGFQVVDGQVMSSRAYWPDSKRCERAAIPGKTGQWKSFFLRHLAAQDIRQPRLRPSPVLSLDGAVSPTA